MKLARKLIALAVIVLSAGCGPEVPREELGTIVTEIPSFDPEEQKYPLPRLGTSPDETTEPESAGNTVIPGSK